MPCDNRWEGEFQLLGSGNDSKAATEDFDNQLDQRLKSLIEKLDCSKKDYARESGLGEGEASKQFLFTYRLDGDDKPKEVDREVVVFFNGKFTKTKMKSWERSCTVKYGCWCFDIGIISK